MEHTINITGITDGADFKLKFSDLIKVTNIYQQFFPIGQMIDNCTDLGHIYASRIEFQGFMPPLLTQQNGAARNLQIDSLLGFIIKVSIIIINSKNLNP